MRYVMSCLEILVHKALHNVVMKLHCIACWSSWSLSRRSTKLLMVLLQFSLLAPSSLCSSGHCITDIKTMGQGFGSGTCISEQSIVALHMSCSECSSAFVIARL